MPTATGQKIKAKGTICMMLIPVSRPEVAPCVSEFCWSLLSQADCQTGSEAGTRNSRVLEDRTRGGASSISACLAGPRPEGDAPLGLPDRFRLGAAGDQHGQEGDEEDPHGMGSLRSRLGPDE